MTSRPMRGAGGRVAAASLPGDCGRRIGGYGEPMKQLALLALMLLVGRLSAQTLEQADVFPFGMDGVKV
jgi:hypothetical protein